MQANPEFERACAQLDAMPDGAVTKQFRFMCPNCRLRSAYPCGDRLYICLNEKCPGSSRDEVPGRYALKLTYDALRGARLLPWKEVEERDRIRGAHPLGVLLRLLPVYQMSAR